MRTQRTRTTIVGVGFALLASADRDRGARPDSSPDARGRPGAPSG
jgi:hypothetical protein